MVEIKQMGKRYTNTHQKKAGLTMPTSDNVEFTGRSITTKKMINNNREISPPRIYKIVNLFDETNKIISNYIRQALNIGRSKQRNK